MVNSHKNLLLRNHWANCNQTLVEWSLDGPFQNCVRWSRLSTKMAAKLKIEKRGDEIKKNLLWNYWVNLNQTLLKWFKFWKGPSKDHSTKVWLQLAQWFLRRRFLCEFTIGSYVKLSSAVGAILAKPPDTFLEENHPMTISSKFCSYWANGFRKDFYGNFP
jgi:hypothetical protein